MLERFGVSQWHSSILYIFIQILARPLQNIINNKLAIDIFLYEPAILSSHQLSTSSYKIQIVTSKSPISPPPVVLLLRSL
jgi:hypothetical protein